MYELTHHFSGCRNIYYFLVTKDRAKSVSKTVYRKKTSKWHLKNREKRVSKRAKPFTHNSIKLTINTALKTKFSIKDFFSKCDQIHTKQKQWIWSHLLKKPLMENSIFCAVLLPLGDSSLVFWTRIWQLDSLFQSQQVQMYVINFFFNFGKLGNLDKSKISHGLTFV